MRKDMSVPWIELLPQNVSGRNKEIHENSQICHSSDWFPNQTLPDEVAWGGGNEEIFFLSPFGVKYLFCNTYRPHGGACPLSAALNIRN
jgi:hypothetical protein